MTQAALTAVDTWINHEWRQKERQFRQDRVAWRKEDLQYREVEKDLAEEGREFRCLKRRWRDEDIQQRRVENSRYLWTRVKELNRREVEEKAEHMWSVSWLAALVAGFTMTAPVEFSYNDSSPPLGLLTAYAIASGIVPGLMTVAAMMCVHLLGGVLKMGKWFVAEDGEEEFMGRCRFFAEGRSSQLAPPAPRRSFDRFWDYRCEDDWRWAFQFFSSGVTVFFVLLGCMGFLKFSPNIWIPVAFTAVLLVSAVFWMWIQYRWGKYLTSGLKGGRTMGGVHEIRPRHAPAGHAFDWHIRPIRYASQEDHPTGLEHTRQNSSSSLLSAASDPRRREILSAWPPVVTQSPVRGGAPAVPDKDDILTHAVELAATSSLSDMESGVGRI